MKRIHIYSSILMIIAVLFAACKKNNVSPQSPQNNCNIVTITTLDLIPKHLNFTYDNSGRISRITESTFNYTFNFIYGSDSIQFEEFNGDPSNLSNLQESFSGTIDNSGLVQSGTDKIYNGGIEDTGLSATINYTYDGQGELIKRVLHRGVNMPETDTFTWQNGNLISWDSGGGDIVSFEYYTDKPSMKGDFFWIAGLFPGSDGLQIRSKNLVKDMIQPGNNTNSDTDFNYTFDSQGKISQMTVTGVALASSLYTANSYQWQCQ